MAKSRQKVLLVGATGTIGRVVAADLSQRHEVVPAGSRTGALRMDLSDAASIRAAFGRVGPVDAVVCTAGSANFTPLADIPAADIATSVYGLGLTNKLLGQINLALAARDHLNDGGSITLITGILVDQPILAGSPASVANGGVEAFVRAAAIELPRGIRINAVSPSVLEEASADVRAFFPGIEAVPAARVVLAFRRSVEGLQTGQVYRVI